MLQVIFHAYTKKMPMIQDVPAKWSFPPDLSSGKCFGGLETKCPRIVYQIGTQSRPLGKSNQRYELENGLRYEGQFLPGGIW